MGGNENVHSALTIMINVLKQQDASSQDSEFILDLVAFFRLSMISLLDIGTESFTLIAHLDFES